MCAVDITYYIPNSVAFLVLVIVKSNRGSGLKDISNDNATKSCFDALCARTNCETARF